MTDFPNAIARLLAFYMDYSKCHPIWLKFAVDALSYMVANTTTNEYRARVLALVWLAMLEVGKYIMIKI